MEYKDLSKVYEAKMTYDKLKTLSKEEHIALVNERREKGVFKMSRVEYMRWEKFRKMHHECMYDENGFYKFGAIGGGMKLTSHFKADGTYEVHAFCEGCNSGINLSKEQLGFTEADVPNNIDFERGYNYYGKKSMTTIEYARYKAFVEDHKNDIESIHVSFVGTGLGNIICVYDDKTMEYADLTDIDCW